MDDPAGVVVVEWGEPDRGVDVDAGFVDLDLGVVGPYPPGSPQASEVRAFFPKDGATVEDR